MYKIGLIVNPIEKLEAWIRRRLRMCLWKQWKKIPTKYHNLIKLGLPD